MDKIYKKMCKMAKEASQLQRRNDGLFLLAIYDERRMGGKVKAFKQEAGTVDKRYTINVLMQTLTHLMKEDNPEAFKELEKLKAKAKDGK